jgi:hypothetical protein
VARKKKQKKFTAVRELKALARQLMGTPPSQRIVPDGRRKQAASEKHKSTLGRLLREDEDS